MIRLFTVTTVILIGAALGAVDPCKSGLAPNQRPGPYAALVSVGPQRGQHHCYICAAEDRPIVIVFARSLSEPLGQLAKQLDNAVKEHKSAELRSWVTFLADDQTSLDPKVVQWARKHAISNVPCAVFEDTVGPPTYLLTHEADVTVLLAVKKKVVANFAFRAGELSDAAIREIVKTLPKIIAAKKG